MKVVKRNGIEQDFNVDKIINAITAAFNACEKPLPKSITKQTFLDWYESDSVTVEQIQNDVEEFLMAEGYYDVAKAYILYRANREKTRRIADKIKYVKNYAKSTGNAASNSNTDANANNSIKNVASIDPEVFKDDIRIMQRQMMKDELNLLYPDTTLGKQYIKDLNQHIIYAHDESNSSIQKAYCGAYTLYPLMLEGVGNLDNITPTPPNDIASFSGQVTNAVFALSAQTKGAVALGDYIVTLNYYIIQDFGKKWYDHLNDSICNNFVIFPEKRTILREIQKGMKQFIFGINQPAGNRGFQSPFTNLNFFDSYYFEAMFGDYSYPDGTKPEWKAIDILQRIFIELLRELRLVTPLTFPVTTFALLYDENGYKDKEYEQLCAEEWAKGSSHFLYHSSNADSLSSCCRVQNKINENTFSSTTGMVGLMTGSCNVITLNINRILQDYIKLDYQSNKLTVPFDDFIKLGSFKEYLSNILNRVYKYHIAYKTMLYELEDLGMITYSSANYLYIKKLYSTIGLIGYYEAAKFLGLEDGSKEYNEFIKLILNTVSKENKKHSIYDKKRPFVFNLECIPGENLAVKLYKWDKEDGYIVPNDQNLYNCYFFNPWKETDPLKKLAAHGKDISAASDGGQGCHINLDSHLSVKQYLKLMKYAREVGNNYFTFNIPITKCKDCGHVVNSPIIECPKCHSHNLTYFTRVIGFLTDVANWAIERQKEFFERVFGTRKAKEFLNKWNT